MKHKTNESLCIYNIKVVPNTLFKINSARFHYILTNKKQNPKNLPQILSEKFHWIHSVLIFIFENISVTIERD